MSGEKKDNIKNQGKSNDKNRIENKHKVTNKGNNIKGNVLNGTLYECFTRFYGVILATFLLIIFAVFFLNDKNITTQTVQIFFIGGLVPLGLFTVYMLSKKKLDANTMIVLIIITGILLRVVYTLYSPFTIRQHDVIGSSFNHLDYIKLLANKMTLPQVDYCQAYHPPVHHGLSAIFYSLGKSMGLNDFYAFRLVQVEMIFLNSMTMIFFYKILKEIKCKKLIAILAIAIFAFYPYNIYFAAFLNNDNTMLFFYTVTLYYIIKWLNANTYKNVVLMAVFLSISILTKKPAIILIPIILAAFIAAYLKKRDSIELLVKQFALFMCISVPLSISFQLRNYIMFKQGLTYAPGVGFEKYANTLKNLFYIPLKGIFKQPFTPDPYTGKSELFADYALKSSLFGEWRFPSLESIASMLIIITLVIGIIIVLYLIIANKKLLNGHGFVFVLNLILPLALLLQSRLSNPVVCAQNFRYAIAALISVAFFYGCSVNKFSGTRFKFMKYVLYACTIAFCIISAAFILKIGMAPSDAYNYQ